MIRILLFVLGFITLASCNEKVVQLPETSNQAITKVLDVSPAYLFYDEETNSAEFNRKNIIGTTNWLVNVDKRLTLKQAMPHIIYLQNKRKKASMHKNSLARNYFTCSNPDIKNLAFIDFTNVEYLRDYTRMPENEISVKLVFSYTSDIKMVFPEQKLIADLNTFQEVMKRELPRSEKDSIKLYLAFNENLLFQDYISFKSELLELDFDSYVISREELIFN